MHIAESQRIILETINSHDGQWNWYKVGRVCIGLLDSPADLVLKPLLDAGYVEERAVEDEPLPRLHLTETGKQFLQSLHSN